eukprot:5186613-Ditylum_brightwellii.AAC.1
MNFPQLSRAVSWAGLFILPSKSCVPLSTHVLSYNGGEGILPGLAKGTNTTKQLFSTSKP